MIQNSQPIQSQNPDYIETARNCLAELAQTLPPDVLVQFIQEIYSSRQLVAPQDTTMMHMQLTEENIQQHTFSGLPNTQYHYESPTENNSGLPGMDPTSVFPHTESHGEMAFPNYPPLPVEAESARVPLPSERPFDSISEGQAEPTLDGPVESPVESPVVRPAERPTNVAQSQGSGVDRRQGGYSCGLCLDAVDGGTPIVCIRKNDLKRHITTFHLRNKQWVCRVSGCGRVFDRNKAYNDHAKSHSLRVRAAANPPLELNLCPQRVFSCGFEGCERVFEATTDDGARETGDAYLEHLMYHYSERSASRPEWSYNTRFRNLLRQDGIIHAVNQVDFTREWRPEHTLAMRRVLETGHFTANNVRALVRYIRRLSSPTYSLESDTEGSRYAIPIMSQCCVPVNGHSNLASGDGPEQTQTRGKAAKGKKAVTKTQRKKHRAAIKAKSEKRSGVLSPSTSPIPARSIPRQFTVDQLPVTLPPSPALSVLGTPMSVTGNFTSSPEMQAQSMNWAATVSSRPILQHQASFSASYSASGVGSPTLGHVDFH